MGIRTIAIAITLGVGARAVAQERVLEVVASESLLAPLKLIAAEYEKSKPRVKVRIGNVEAGTRRSNADVTLRAFDTRPSEGRLFARERLVVAYKADEQRISKFSHIGLTLGLALPNAKTLAGKLAASAIEAAGAAYGKDWLANVRRNADVVADSAEAALEAVLEGKADAAIVPASVAKARSDKLKWVPLPVEYAPSLEYYAAISERASQRALAGAFVEYLFAGGAQARLEAAGFTSPLHAPAELVVVRPASTTRLFTAALPTMKMASVTVRDARGERRTLRGVDLRAILPDRTGTITFTGADGASVSIRASELRRSGGVLTPLASGNYRVVLPSKPTAQWVRWLRRIEVR